MQDRKLMIDDQVIDLEKLMAVLRRIFACDTCSYDEYSLLQIMVSEAVFDKDYAKTQLGLFQAHFILRHGLYRLQEEHQAQGFSLDIGMMNIIKAPSLKNETKTLVGHADQLRFFYEDEIYLFQATEESVASLLSDFWKAYAAFERGQIGREDALTVLGLESNASDQQIKARYRVLAMRYHPDRGGDGSLLQKINAAMATLKQHTKRRY